MNVHIEFTNRPCHTEPVDLSEIRSLRTPRGRTEQMGFESAILYEANSCAFSTYVLNEARFEHIRPLGRVHKFREFGASMRTLGYHPLFAIARFLKYFVTGTVTGRIGSLYMLYYYLTYKPVEAIIVCIVKKSDITLDESKSTS
jgi:hypothetical protein